jgi:peptide-methionine (S)-S-oxide reductase
MRAVLSGLILVALLMLASPLRADDRTTATSSGLKTAIFAGGCFWSMEHAFKGLDGVHNLSVGYTGGKTTNPTYIEVSRGGTGHREALQITYDPEKISYERLLDIYWRNTDPFNGKGQFCDTGDNYRPAVFARNDEQKKSAEASKAALEKRFGKPVATEILPAQMFYAAEEYHQNYAEEHEFMYGMYRDSCGQDRTLRKIWGNEAGGGIDRKAK